jgi:hypothetical protein
VPGPSLGVNLFYRRDKRCRPSVSSPLSSRTLQFAAR